MPVLHSKGLDGCLSIGFPHLIVTIHFPEEEMRQGFELYGGREMTRLSGGSCGIWIEPSCPALEGEVPFVYTFCLSIHLSVDT